MARENPALVVDHGSQELHQVHGGGSARKSFAEVTPALRRKKAAEWKSAAEDALEAAEQFGLQTGVLKVKLKPKAIAKSHRPQYLLQQAGRTRIIGASHIGTLLVSVSTQSASATQDAFLHNATQDGTADLSTIESIEPYSAVDRKPTAGHSEAYDYGAVVTLFDFRDEGLNAEAQASVDGLLERHHRIPHSRRPRTLLLKDVTDAEIRELAKHPAVRRIWPNSAVTVPEFLPATSGDSTIPAPAEGSVYPTVGLLDDGVSRVHPRSCPGSWPGRLTRPRRRTTGTTTMALSLPASLQDATR